MTSSFSGSYKPGTSVESRTLDQLDPSKQSFVNRDFVKNIAWLNQSVGTLSKFTQTLQKGVDSANQDIFGVINDLISEITILFAGGQPTGFEWGDLQYIFQAWGAMLGINPGTPFPLNIVQAMEYMFTTWIAPTEQFTDAIFDAQNAWAEELGLSQDFLDALHAYQHAIEALNLANTDAFYQGIHDLLDLFQPQDEASQEFWQSIIDLFDAGDPLDLKPIFAEWADLGIPFMNALTDLTNNLNAFLHPADVISAGQIQELSANIVPVPSGNTATWNIGSNNIYAWVYDNAKEAFTTLGTGMPKRVLTEKKFTCIPDQTLVCDALVEWAGVPSGQTGFGIQVAFFQGNTEKLNYTINIPSGHAPTASDIALHQELVVPQNVDGMKIGVYVDDTITQGQVWAKNLSVKISGLIHISWVAQLRDELNNLMPLDVWWNALQVPVGNQEAIEQWIKDVLTPESWLDAGKLFGSLPGNLIDWVPIGSLVQDSGNFLADPKFDDSEGIDGKGIYTWDGTQGYSGYGSAKTSGDGTEKALLTKDKTSAVKNNQITVGAMIKWSMLAVNGSGAKFAIDIILYDGNKKLDTIRIAHMDTPVQNSDWVYIGNTYLIDNPDTTAYRVRLVVTDQVTSGEIWWDDAINQKVQMIALDWIDGAVDWLTTLGDQIDTFLQESLTALEGLFDPDGDAWSWINDLGDALNDMWTDAQDAIAQSQNAWDNSELGKSLANAAQQFAQQVDAARVAGEQWLKNFFEDATILLDFFHTSYPVGHSTDGPEHTELFQGKQKRTYWAAWNRQMIGLGWAQASEATPIEPLPAVSTKFNALSVAVRSGADGTDVEEGEELTDNEVQVQEAVGSLRNSISDTAAQVDDMQAAITGAGAAMVTAVPSGHNSSWGPDWTLVGGTGAANTWFTWKTGNPLIGFYNTNYPDAAAGVQVSLVTASANQTPWLGSSNAYIFAISHASTKTAAADMLFSRMYYNRVQFGYYRNGTFTVLKTYTSSAPFNPSVRLQHVVVAVPGSTNKIRYAVTLNGKVVINATDTDTTLPFTLPTSGIHGQGMAADGSYVPARVSRWQVRPGGSTWIPGSMVMASNLDALGFTAGNHLTAGLTIAHADPEKFELTTAFGAAGGGIVFKDSAMYAIEVIFMTTTSSGTSSKLDADQYVRPIIAQNETLVGAGSDIVGTNSLVASVTAVSHTFIRMIRGGDIISIGAGTNKTVYGKMIVYAAKLGRG